MPLNMLEPFQMDNATHIVWRMVAIKINLVLIVTGISKNANMDVKIISTWWQMVNADKNSPPMEHVSCTLFKNSCCWKHKHYFVRLYIYGLLWIKCLAVSDILQALNGKAAISMVNVHTFVE